jgi:hypothetical protein
MPPPFVPEVGDDLDTTNFDVRFTSQPALDSPVESPGDMSPSLAAGAADLFAGFTYVPSSIVRDASSLAPRSPRLRRAGSPLRPARGGDTDVSLVRVCVGGRFGKSC